MKVFNLKHPWKYKDETIIKKIHEFITKHSTKDLLIISDRVVCNITCRFSENYVGTLFDYISQNIIKLKGESRYKYES